MAHFWLPGERTTPEKVAGQGLAFFGVAISIIWRGSGGEASLPGDLLTPLSAFFWAGERFGGVDRSEGRRTRPAIGPASIGLSADLYDSGVFSPLYQ